jgi:serine protease Do
VTAAAARRRDFLNKQNNFTVLICGIPAALALVLPAGSASAQRDPQSSPQDYADCQQSADAARGVAACSRIANDPAQSTADRVVAYRWLGNDHLAAGALDQAIADYSNAIRFDPQSAPTYVSRALANFQKGDRMAAIADYRQAVAIDPARVSGMADGNAGLTPITQAAAELLDAVVEIERAPSASKTGSALGFVIDASGLVVAPRHAVGDAKNVVLALNGGTRLDADVVGADARTDLALLKVKTNRHLSALHFGDSSKVNVGERLAGFATASVAEDLLKIGTVTALDQFLGVGPFDRFIAIDLAMGQPASGQPAEGTGGPILNGIGEVVGVHLATSAGKVFATPAADVVPIIDQLRRYGAVRRGWLGVQVGPVTDAKAESLNVKPPRGALIGELFDGGPAKAADIALNDVVVKFDGHDIKEPRDLARVVADTPPGKYVDVVVIRYGKEETHRLMVGRLDDSAQAAVSSALPKGAIGQTLGLELSSLSDDLREKFKVRYDVHGVIITGVDANTAASTDAHLAPGDVIVELEFQAITDPAGIRTRIDQLKSEGKRAALLLVHKPDGANHYVAVRLQ